MRRGDGGQATIEAALTLPIVLLGLLLIVQVGVVVRDALALAQAAREGARAAAVSALDEDARRAVVESAGPLEAARISIDIRPGQGQRRRGDEVTVLLGYHERLRIPVVSRIVSLDLPLRASATMRQEREIATPAPEASPSPQDSGAPP